MRKSVRSCAVLLALALAGACGGCAAPLRYDNAAARASTLLRPVSGAAEDRTYRNSRYEGVHFPVVAVREPEVREGEAGDPERQAFESDLREAVWAATQEALRASGRFGAVVPAPGGADVPEADLVCTTEVLPHVAALGQSVTRDPVFRDPRPKVIAVYTLEDAKAGEVVFKYTGWSVSTWDYGPWAMEDLIARGVALSLEFGETVKED